MTEIVEEPMNPAFPESQIESKETVWLNKLRAAVLGANDGIVSVATALTGLLGQVSTSTLALTATAVTLAGAFSMSAGEYVSVSAQRDVEREKGQEETSPVHAALASFFSFLAGAVIPAVSTCVVSMYCDRSGVSRPWWAVLVIGLAVVFSLALTSMLASMRTSNRVRAVLRMVAVGVVSMIVGVFVNSIIGFVAS